MIESKMWSAIRLDHAVSSVNPALDVSGNIIVCSLTFGEVKDGDAIRLKAPLTNRLANVSIESNAQLRKCPPLRIAQEFVKEPTVDAAIKVPVGNCRLCDLRLVYLVFVAAEAKIQPPVSFRVIVFQLLKRKAAALHKSGSHLSLEFVERTSHAGA